MTARRSPELRPDAEPAPQVAVRDRAAGAVARTRALGLHFIGHFLGIVGLPAEDGRSRLLLEVEPGTRPGAPVSPVSLAVVADLAMGTAIRTLLGPGRRLSTVAMTANYLETVVTGPVTAAAIAPQVGDDGRAFARCELSDTRGVLVGTIDAWFVALPAPNGRPLAPIPWELPEPRHVPPLTDAQMTAAERGAIEACVEAGRRAAAGRTSVVEELIRPVVLDSAGDEVTGELRIGFAHTNRVGDVQGGILFGAAALAARRVVADDMRLADGHVQFLAPAHGRDLTVTASVSRQGRRTAFTETRSTVAGGLVAAGAFTFHRLADRDEG